MWMLMGREEIYALSSIPIRKIINQYGDMCDILKSKMFWNAYH